MDLFVSLFSQILAGLSLAQMIVNEGVQRGRQEGRIEGLQEGIQANIRTCKTFKISKSDTIKNVVKEFALSEDEAKAYVEKYW